MVHQKRQLHLAEESLGDDAMPGKRVSFVENEQKTAKEFLYSSPRSI